MVVKTDVWKLGQLLKRAGFKNKVHQIKIALAASADYDIKHTFGDYETVMKILESFAGIKSLHYTDFLTPYEYAEGDSTYPVLHPKNV